MKNQTVRISIVVLASVLTIALSTSALAQSFKQIPVKGGAKMMQIASGGHSVWALATNGQPYIYQNNQFVLANSRSLSQIAVGGGNVRQADTVWALDSATNIYRASKNGTSWVFKQMPGNLDFIAVGIGYDDNCHPYEVWGINSASLIYRFNFCIHNWENIPGSLRTLVIGNGDIWGINSSDQLYRFDFDTFGFTGYDLGASPATSVTAGANGVWLLSCTFGKFEVCQPYQYNPGMQMFGELQTIPEGLVIVDIQAGGDGAWGLGYHVGSHTGAIIRFDSESIGYQVPGTLVSISVGDGGGVWGLDGAGQPYSFTTP